MLKEKERMRERERERESKRGSGGCSSVGRVVATDTRRPQFETGLWQIFA